MRWKLNMGSSDSAFRCHMILKLLKKKEDAVLNIKIEINKEEVMNKEVMHLIKPTAVCSEKQCVSRREAAKQQPFSKLYNFSLCLHSQFVWVLLSGGPGAST